MYFCPPRVELQQVTRLSSWCWGTLLFVIRHANSSKWPSKKNRLMTALLESNCNKSLTSLMLGHNCIRDDGCKHLKRFLERNSTVTSLQVFLTHTHTHAHTHMHTRKHMHTHIHARTHTHTHTQINTHTHTHIRTHTHTHALTELILSRASF